MNNLERLKNRILDEAESRAADIRREAEEKAQSLVQRAEKDGRDEAAAILAKAKAEAEDTRRRILTNAQLEARRTVLAAKGALLSEVFRETLARLESMDDAAYREMQARLMVEAATGGEDEILLNERDKRRLDEAFFADVNARLRRSGKSGSVRLSQETRPIKGGFVLRSASLEIDSSFEARMRQVQDNLEPDVARLLFAEPQTSTPQ